MDEITPILVMSLIAIGGVVCIFYLCLKPLENAVLRPPDVNHIQTISTPPEEEWLQFSPTSVGPESRHLFTNNNNQSRNRDIAFNIDDIYIPGLGLRTDDELNNSDDYGFLNVNNGLNHPLAIYNALNIPSNNNDRNLNQPSLNLHKPLNKIETPPPSYYEATRYLYNINYSHRQNQSDTNRGLYVNDNVSANIASYNTGGFDRNGITAGARERRVGWNYGQTDTNQIGWHYGQNNNMDIDGNTANIGGNNIGVAGNSRNSVHSATPVPSFVRTGVEGNDRSGEGNDTGYRDREDISERTGYNNDEGITATGPGYSGEGSNRNEMKNNISRGVIENDATIISPIYRDGNGRCDSNLHTRSKLCNCDSTDHIKI